MAELVTLRTRLAVYLPGMTNDSLDSWLLESAKQHSYDTVNEVPIVKSNMIIHYARYIALQTKVIETAENAALNIKGTSVNKSGASSNYNAAVKRAWSDYRRAGGRLGSMAIRVSLTRADGR